MIYVYKQPTAKWGFLALMVFSFAMEYFRQKSRRVNRLVLLVLLPFMRRHEIKGVAATTPLLVSVTFLIWTFPLSTVELALLFLAFADPLASMVGILFGKTKWLYGKSIEGSLAAAAVCSFVFYAFIWARLGMLSPSWSLVVMAGFIGAIAEALPIFNLDDNLTMPILSATGLWVLLFFSGYLV